MVFDLLIPIDAIALEPAAVDSVADQHQRDPKFAGCCFARPIFQLANFGQLCVSDAVGQAKEQLAMPALSSQQRNGGRA